MNIIKSTTEIPVSNINVLVYGQPGAGKTSLSFTTQKPLLLDFDKGAYRSGFRRGDVVEINNWVEIARIKPEELQQYSTIIIDTVGRALDFLTSHLIDNDSKLARKDGALTLQGYGALKASFAIWLKMLRTLGKDVIMLAHDKEDKEGDNKYVRPDIQGSSYNEIIKLADAMGYLFKTGQKTVLNFNPCEKWVGKNTAQLKEQFVPDFLEAPEYFTGLISTMKESMGKASKAQSDAMNFILNKKEAISKIQKADDLNDFLTSLRTDKNLVAGVRSQLWEMLQARAELIKCAFHAGDKRFYAVEPIVSVSNTPANEDDDFMKLFDDKAA
jgi:phage nucleotide-binding protein